MQGIFKGIKFSINLEHVECSHVGTKELITMFLESYLDEYSPANGEPLAYVRARFLADFPQMTLSKAKPERYIHDAIY